jgi:DNA-binding CsgD family transcriptional regulator
MESGLVRGCSCTLPRSAYTSIPPTRTMRPLDTNELEALTLFAIGKTADEIAITLGVSQSMANHYVRIAARKLGGRNRVHAVAIAVSTGVIDPARVQR